MRSPLKRRNPSKGSSPVSTWTRIQRTQASSVSQSLERFLAGFHMPRQRIGRYVKRVSQSLERFLAGFHGARPGQDHCAGESRNPSKGSSPVSTSYSTTSHKFRLMSQSLERFLAGFHSHAQCPVTTSTSVAIPRKVPRRFPLYRDGILRGDVLTSQSLERFLAGFHTTLASVAVTDSTSRNPSKGSSPVSTVNDFDLRALWNMSQSLERFLAGFHRCGSDFIGSTGKRRNPSKGSSPVSTQDMEAHQIGGSHCRNPSKGSSPVSTHGDPAALGRLPHVAIPRKVPRRFPQTTTTTQQEYPEGCRNPSKGSSPVSTRERIDDATTTRAVSQSLERFLAGFHLVRRERMARDVHVAIPRKVPRRFPRKS